MSYFKHTYVASNATDGANSAAFRVDHVAFIANDGASAITFNFDAATTASGAFSVKGGETIREIPRSATTLHYVSASTTGIAFRALGLG